MYELFLLSILFLMDAYVYEYNFSINSYYLSYFPLSDHWVSQHCIRWLHFKLHNIAL